MKISRGVFAFFASIFLLVGLDNHTIYFRFFLVFFIFIILTAATAATTTKDE